MGHLASQDEDRHGTRVIGGRADIACLFFGAAAMLFAAIAVATSIWISRTNMADPFVFGTTVLWSAMDPAGYYFCDVIMFFHPQPLQIVNHPGLSMTFTGALAARSTYAVFAGADAYVDYWVRHRILLNGMLAALSSAVLLACCQPLLLVLRHFMDRSAAYMGCTLFLLSPPVLLYMGRFSPEAWMTYFTLWSVHLSLRMLDVGGGLRISAAMGVCTALAVLAKWLAFPLLALNLYCLIAARPAGWKPTLHRVLLYGVAGTIVAGGLFSRVAATDVVRGLTADLYDERGAHGLAWIFSQPYERPFVIHHALVFLLGGLGLIAMYRLKEDTRPRLVPLVGTLALMALLTLRRPFWHYFFAFYWFFPAAAAYGLTLMIGSRFAWRGGLATIASGLIVIALLDLPYYRGIVGTYERYRQLFSQRADLAREHPAWVPAPWEFPIGDFEATRNTSHVVAFYSGFPLQPVLEQQRRDEDIAERPN